MKTTDRDRAASVPIAHILSFLQDLAPLELAESWDNVGLLWGDDSVSVTRVLTCLTLTRDVAAEAVDRGAGLIVSHHPVLFHPVRQLTIATPQGRLLLDVARHGIAVYSAHTAYDSAAAGINHQLVQRLELQSIGVLRASPRFADLANPADRLGAGRFGTLGRTRTLRDFVADVRTRLEVTRIDYVGPPDAEISRVAIACGSGGDFIGDALTHGCEALVTGEARFHDCLDARERGLALVLVGHFASERPAMLQLAEQISAGFPTLTVWASEVETDPIERL
jgi:dinuclear metal center YbgI/SA1388 family protein